MKKLIMLVILAVTSQAKASSENLPIYNYAVQSGSFQDAGAFVSRIHYRIPNTVWLCDITYGNRGLIARCSAPGSAGLVEAITRVSCAQSDSDAETMHLSTLDLGNYASVYIACKRDLYDDGF
jgi:hypothetical protein